MSDLFGDIREAIRPIAGDDITHVELDQAVHAVLDLLAGGVSAEAVAAARGAHPPVLTISLTGDALQDFLGQWRRSLVSQAQANIISAE